MTLHESIFALLRKVDSRSFWGISIRQVMASQDHYKMMDLVADLRSEGREHPETMKAIIGARAYELIMAG